MWAARLGRIVFSDVLGIQSVERGKAWIEGCWILLSRSNGRRPSPLAEEKVSAKPTDEEKGC
jgi:hypothetical protein